MHGKERDAQLMHYAACSMQLVQCHLSARPSAESRTRFLGCFFWSLSFLSFLLLVTARRMYPGALKDPRCRTICIGIVITERRH